MWATASYRYIENKKSEGGTVREGQIILGEAHIIGWAVCRLQKKNILKWHTLNLQISYTKITAEICTYYSCDGYINVVQRSCKCVR